MRTKWLTCEANESHYAKQLHQRDTDGLFVCAPCVPDSTWKKYPGSKQRALAEHRTSLKRAAQARANFGGTHENQKQQQQKHGASPARSGVRS